MYESYEHDAQAEILVPVCSAVISLLARFAAGIIVVAGIFLLLRQFFSVFTAFVAGLTLTNLFLVGLLLNKRRTWRCGVEGTDRMKSRKWQSILQIRKLVRRDPRFEARRNTARLWSCTAAPDCRAAKYAESAVLHRRGWAVISVNITAT